MARDNLYSTTVMWVKVTLPVIALGLLSTLFLFSSTPDPDAALPYAEFDIDEITREQRVSQPRFAGVLEDGRELILVADTVASTNGSTDLIQARMIEGRMDVSDGEYLILESAAGDFDMPGQLATLTEGVLMRSSMGYRLESSQLELAMNRIEMRAPEPVHITGPGLDLTADAMEWVGPEGEAIVHFTGSVRLIYDPES